MSEPLTGALSGQHPFCHEIRSFYLALTLHEGHRKLTQPREEESSSRGLSLSPSIQEKKYSSRGQGSQEAFLSLRQCSRQEINTRRGIAVLAAVCATCVWFFSVPAEIRRSHICMALTETQQEKQQRCVDSVTVMLVDICLLRVRMRRVVSTSSQRASN